MASTAPAMLEICDLQTTPIDFQDCTKACIHQGPLSLDEKADDRPRFFTPYRDEYFTHKELPESFHNLNPQEENHINVQGLHLFMESYLGSVYTQKPRGIYYRAWGDLNFGELSEPKYFWQVSFTCLTSTKFDRYFRPVLGPNEALPHVKCMMESDSVEDDRLLRGEIITIIQIMAGRLNTKSVRAHVMAPVMLYSIMGPQHLRVLEAYFTGENLVIRKTKLYDMTKYDASTLDQLTRWWLGHAGGQTTVIDRELLDS
ncbi:uncharacterized protein LDX57_000886 [Aspergillus melleus]|uniref:uncharacterized protein n=1 Tax=Aspergillus melleus TaxID=138277 RepID=UPI001E8CDE92|nr:uncharacterized protein LDX57_000886 [Aspergillus melleus]KAH8423130.1 hypothetical protein LDX57_000886 [Aspergillus melleus]